MLRFGPLLVLWLFSSAVNLLDLSTEGARPLFSMIEQSPYQATPSSDYLYGSSGGGGSGGGGGGAGVPECGTPGIRWK
jgi:hypothetical protein